MNTMLITIVNSSIKTFFSMINSLWGFILSFFILIGSLIVENEVAFYAVFTAIGFDMIWGILAAVKQKRFVVTKLLKKTFVKLFLYISVFVMIMLIEHGLHDDWYLGTRIVCTFAACCELWSIFANMLIVKPDFPFISLLRKSLAGEIANKLNLSKEEIEQELNKQNGDKSNICE